MGRFVGQSVIGGLACIALDTVQEREIRELLLVNQVNSAVKHYRAAAHFSYDTTAANILART
jgi:hypothetical protein